MHIAHPWTPAARRRCVVAVGVTLTLVTLAACSGSTGGTAAPSGSKVATAKPTISTDSGSAMGRVPKVGDCWSATPAHLFTFAWQGDGPVACTQPHNTVTYRVGTLPKGLDYVRTKAYTLSTVPTVTRVCGEAFADAYLGHRDLTPPLRVGDTYFVPSEQQWAAGARWFRCDLGFPDVYTNPTRRRQWQPLPANLRAAVASNDMPFRYCSTGSLRGGPNSKGSSTGKCGDRPRWLATKAINVAKTRHEPWPGNDALHRRASTVCSVRGDWWATWEAPTGWLHGLTRVWCWVRRSGPA